MSTFLSDLTSWIPSWAVVSWNAGLVLLGVAGLWLYNKWNIVKTDVEKVISPASTPPPTATP